MIFPVITLALTQPNIQTASIPKVIRLWDGPAPGSLGNGSEDNPDLTVYLPKGVSSHAAVIVCPGGGYVFRAPHEGGPPAAMLSKLGITAFVLKYRIAPRYHYPVQREDVMRAMRLVRYYAPQWGIDPNKIGIMGFSAGGHLAAMAATCFDSGNPNAADPIDKVSSKPDAAMLLYPVITMHKSFTHMGSRIALLGNHPSRAMVNKMSLEQRVTAETPPSFVVATYDDNVVPIQNSLEYVMACWKHHVPVEFHLYAHGPHGFGLGLGNPVLSRWASACGLWLKGLGFTH